MIAGTDFKVPELLMLDGGYSVPGHAAPPRRKNRHSMLEFVLGVSGDDGLAADFVHFCRVRDSASETWRLPGCEGGCRDCDHLHALSDGRPPPDPPESPAAPLSGQPRCTRDWWLIVPEGTTTWVSAGDFGKSAAISALPWTDFE